jgi:hypothetical protein
MSDLLAEFVMECATESVNGHRRFTKQCECCGDLMTAGDYAASHQCVRCQSQDSEQHDTEVPEESNHE